MDTCHQRCIFRQWRRQWNLFLLELLCCIGQIQLIEHAVAPVTSQSTPILLSKRCALGKEPAQISPFCQLIAIQRLIDTIATYLIVTVTDWHHVDTLTRFETDVPIVLGHTCNHMVVGQVPMLTNIGILYPYVRIFFRQWNLGDGILYEDTGMRFTIEVHNLALIVYQVLKT